MPTPEENFAQLGLELPPAPKPVACYKILNVHGKTVYVSGHSPIQRDGTDMKGRVGSEVDIDAGYAAAKQTGLAILATLRDHFGSLDKIKRVIKILGMVNCTPDFQQHPKVINGCSELFAAVWGEDGIAARSAIGMGSLPFNVTTEIEAIFELA
eukprot:TRINITY_DN3969_c0_g2_i1.p1 TRINITY_DN3969_c0_g2~~TRINITY_DN3969_c0_g2_i1.p1  ORF type:complete len:154 (+),score=32.54 TRINITY_DN3969_c0_g2_i1:442-903(+)